MDKRYIIVEDSRKGVTLYNLKYYGINFLTEDQYDLFVKNKKGEKIRTISILNFSMFRYIY